MQQIPKGNATSPRIGVPIGDGLPVTPQGHQDIDFRVEDLIIACAAVDFKWIIDVVHPI
jgi:hypothetical protein